MMKSLRWMLTIVTIAGLLGGCDLSHSRSEVYVAEGVQALNVGDEQHAMNAFGQATSVDPQNANAWYYAGYTQLRVLKNPGAAIDALQKATKLDKSRADAAYELGYAYEQKGWSKKAIPAYRKAVARDPSLASAQFRLASLLEKNGHIRDAIAAYSHAINADPTLRAAWIQLGNIYANYGATEAAIAVFHNALVNIPNDGRLQSALGVALYQAGRLTEAINVLTKATKAAGAGASVTMTLGMAYLQRASNTGTESDRDKATEYFKQALQVCNPAKEKARCEVIKKQLKDLTE